MIFYLLNIDMNGSYYHDIKFSLSQARCGLAGFDSHEVVLLSLFIILSTAVMQAQEEWMHRLPLEKPAPHRFRI